MILALTSVTLFAVFPVQSLIYIPPDQCGPRLNNYRLTLIKSPDVQYASLIARSLDVMSPVVSPDLIEQAIVDGKVVTYEPRFHSFRYMFNIHRGLWSREYPDPGDGKGNVTNQHKYHPLADVNFRHALAHCLPRAYIMGTIFRFIYDPLYTPICEAYGEWHNPDVDDHPYNPGDPLTSPAGEHSAAGILKAAGYVYDEDAWPSGNWICPGDYDQDGQPGTIWVGPGPYDYAINDPGDYVQSDGGYVKWPKPYMVLLQTPRTVSPEECDTGEAFVAGMHQAGLNSIVLEELESAIKQILTYEEWNYDIAWHISSWRSDTSWLLDRFHTSENYRGSYNCYGMWWDQEDGFDAAGNPCKGVDKLLEIMLSSPSHAEQVAACTKLQELLRGGTKANPLPIPAPTDDNWWNWSIPTVEVGARNGYVASQEELKGLVKMKSSGIVNEWSRFTAYWDTPDGNRIAGGGTAADQSLYWLVRGVAECANPLEYTSDYAAAFVDRVIDVLVSYNPYTLQDEPKMAEKWGVEPWTVPGTGEPGTRYWFQLRPGLKWQDGHDYTVDDAKFNWEFCYNWQIPKYWKELAYLHHVEAYPANRTVAVFLEGWFSHYKLHLYGDMAAIIPPQIWNRTWTDLTQILGYAPELAAYGTDMAPGYSPGPYAADVATNLFGTGEWILTGIEPTYAWGDYAANRHYWRKTQEAYDRLGYLFWRVGDTNMDETVNMIDIGTVAHYLFSWNASWPGSPGPNPYGYYIDADFTSANYLPPEGIIDFVDLSVAAKYNGETKFVPA